LLSISINAVTGQPHRAGLDLLPSAPRFSPTPQSPSPTMVSYFVTSGSALMTLARALKSAARDLSNETGESDLSLPLGVRTFDIGRRGLF
jgi:hypothetical protein